MWILFSGGDVLEPTRAWALVAAVLIALVDFKRIAPAFFPRVAALDSGRSLPIT